MGDVDEAEAVDVAVVAGTNIGTVVKIWELLLDLILSMGRVEVREVVEGFVDVEDSEDALGLIINTLSLNYFCHFIFTIKQVTYNYVFVRCFKIKDYGCKKKKKKKKKKIWGGKKKKKKKKKK